MEETKKIIVFASGGSKGGGSGFQKLVEGLLTGILSAKIVAVVSNHANGGVKKIADNFGIKFVHFSGPWEAGEYQQIVEKYNPDLIALSGWIKHAKGLDPKKTINIHPGPLPEFGGQGMFGHHVHEAVLKAYSQKKILFSAVTMHFVTEQYDMGPIIFSYPVHIGKDYDADKIADEVNKIEHGWQAFITNLVVNGIIFWDGKDQKSLVVPEYVPRELIKVSK